MAELPKVLLPTECTASPAQLISLLGASFQGWLEEFAEITPLTKRLAF